jgi:hypothetical protein
MVLLLFPVGRCLMRTPFFDELNETPAERKSTSGWGWWVGAVITILLPLPLYVITWAFNGKGIAKKSWLWRQEITTTIMFWAVAVGAISLILFLLWHFIGNKKKGGGLVNYGFAWKEQAGRKLWKSILLAIVVVFWAYLTLAFSDWAFKTDFRIWVFAVKLMSVLQFKIFLTYLIPFAFYFLIAGLVLHGELRRGRKDGSDLTGWKEMLINIVLLIGGYFLFLFIMYMPLFNGGTLAIPDSHLASIVMFQFLPIFTIVALVSTYFFRQTGHVFVGSFINALLVTWIVVAGQATHFAY